jgi:hypothetical protein
MQQPTTKISHMEIVTSLARNISGALGKQLIRQIDLAHHPSLCDSISSLTSCHQP